jgi:DNA-binding NtrC family response regulator
MSESIEGQGDPPAIVEPEVKSTIPVLVVDDDHSLRESCASLLRAEGFPVTVASGGEEAVEIIRRRHFEIVLLDLYLRDVPGMEVLQAVMKKDPDCVVVMMTGNPSVETSIEALRTGAWDYMPKPFSATHLHILMGRAAHAIVVSRESAKQREKRGTEMGYGTKLPMLGQSGAFKQVVEAARSVARTDATVFLNGESGTGKDLVAQFIHQTSRRSSQSMVSLNCAAIPDNLVESEMFGHVAGSFTGALGDKKGLLEIASGGTLFLDELTAMPMPTQAKLLRVIQDGVIRRVGSTKTDALAEVRFITSTNEDPLEAIEQKRLRKDLYYRLRVFPINIPPLRERPEDIDALSEYYLEEFWTRHRGKEVDRPVFTPEALASLRSRPWLGNVRELQNVMEYVAVLLSPGQRIGAGDVPDLDVEAAQPREVSGSMAMHLGKGYHEARELVLADFERAYLEHAINEAGGNISNAARHAGVDRTTLYRLMEKHGTPRTTKLSEPNRCSSILPRRLNSVDTGRRTTPSRWLRVPRCARRSARCLRSGLPGGPMGRRANTRSIGYWCASPCISMGSRPPAPLRKPRTARRSTTREPRYACWMRFGETCSCSGSVGTFPSMRTVCSLCWSPSTATRGNSSARKRKTWRPALPNPTRSAS